MSDPNFTTGQPSTGPLLEGQAADGATSALDRLRQAVKDSEPPPTAPGPKLGGAADKTIEDLVREMLRPMLKEWLDRNLSPMVEKVVEREIGRLARR